jgi:hypothetical protein
MGILASRAATVYHWAPNMLQGRRKLARAALLLSATTALAAAAANANADSSLIQYDLSGLHIALGGKAGLGYVLTGNTTFGAGFDVGLDGSVDHNVDYAEGFLEPRIDLSYDTGTIGEFFGAAAVIGAGTRSNGDPGGFTFDNPEDVDLGQLHAGWKSGDLLSGLGKDALTVSFGRQDFHVGDGFLIWDGNFDTAGDATYWLAPRTAFDNTAIITLNTGPIRADAFYLKSDKDNDNAELVGGNFEYNWKGVGTFGATYFNFIDSDDELYLRKGLNVASVRATDIQVPGVPGLTLRGEYARQWGNEHGIETDASGWYAEIAYSLADLLPWSPTLSYRYSAFSGDADPDDNENTAFDPLFFGAGRGWGTWYQGEIVGEYLLFNSNNDVHMVQLNVKPSDSLSTGLLYFNFSLDKANYFGTPIKDKSFANEIDLYADWNVTDHIYFGAVAGLGWASAAAEEVVGDDDTYQLAEFLVTVTY